jgi:site-specific DNA recombinase
MLAVCASFAVPPRKTRNTNDSSVACCAPNSYVFAFESGDLPAGVMCSAIRVKALGEQAADLRRQDLPDMLEDEPGVTIPDAALLDTLRKQIAGVVKEGATKERKRLVEALVHHVCVDSHDSITPVFRVPTTTTDREVRASSGLVEKSGWLFEPC